MAKRYYQNKSTKADRMANGYYEESAPRGYEERMPRGDESSRAYYEERSTRGDGSATREDYRRTMEMRDAGMIQEDRSAVANLPQDQIYKSYSYNYKWSPEVLDDTERGVDRQLDNDHRIMMKDFKPGHIS